MKKKNHKTLGRGDSLPLIIPNLKKFNLIKYSLRDCLSSIDNYSSLKKYSAQDRLIINLKYLKNLLDEVIELKNVK